MNTYKTWLPMFQGFYGSVWSVNEFTDQIDYLNKNREENGLLTKLENFDILDVDYDEYYEDLSRKIVEYISKEFEDFVSGMVYEMLVSPKEYNFKNDSINVEITLSDENKIFIKDLTLKNWDFICDEIKKRHTSCDGFISFYNNDFLLWLKAENKESVGLENFEHIFNHEYMFGCLLEILYMSEFDYEDFESMMFQEIEIDIYSYITNYDEYISSEICPTCGEFIPDEKKESFIKAFKELEKDKWRKEEYKRLMGKEPKTIAFSFCEFHE